MFLASIDASGTLRWSEGYGSSGHISEGTCVRFAPDGALFVTGSFDGALDLDVGALESEGQGDLFVARITSP
jgi:hypothetical protein